MQHKEEPPHPSRCRGGEDSEEITHVLQCIVAAAVAVAAVAVAAAAAPHCESHVIRAGV